MSKGFIAVGHGMQPNGVFDPGAVSKDRRWTEQSAGDIIVKAFANTLRGHGVNVDDDAFTNDTNFYGTTRLVNERDYDWVVEIHHDWYGAPEGGYGFWATDEGKRIADALKDGIAKAGYPTLDRMHKQGNFYILRNTKMPAVLFEVGRIGQSDLDEIDELQAMGVALANGMLNYLGVRQERPSPIEPKPQPKPAPRQPARVAPMFPLPPGHYFGRPSSSRYCHSGFYWRSDRPHIERWQQRMRDRGWKISVDGFFGEQSEDVLKAFQKEKGLKVDGLLGPASWRAAWTEPVT